MDKEQQLVFLRSQILCAEIELQAMLVANQIRESHGEVAAYPEQAFMDLINKYGIGHNDVLGALI